MRETMGRARLLGAVFAIGLVAAACSNAGASPGSDGETSLSITAPSDGATVSEPFTVTFDAGVPIGDPSTGDNHVHLCFDGGSCDDVAGSVIAYENSAVVDGLSPGMHTIEASLRNADHSDAGVSTTITVTVSGNGSGSGSDGSGSGSDGSGSDGSGSGGSGSGGGTTGTTGRGYGY
jgi:hypothetical protein